MTTNPRRAVRRSRLQCWPQCCWPAARRATSASPGSARWRRAGRATALRPPIRRCRTRAAERCSGSRSGRRGTRTGPGRPPPGRQRAPRTATRGFDPFAWLARLFGADTGEGESRPAGGSVQASSGMAAQLPESVSGANATAPAAARSRNRQPPPFRPNPAHRRPNRLRQRTAWKRTVSGRARWWRGSGSRLSSMPTASTARPRTSAWCWSRPAGG